MLSRSVSVCVRCQGRVHPPAINGVKDLRVTLRKGGQSEPVVTLVPRNTHLSEPVLGFHTLAGNGVVLEWLAPAEGKVDIDMEAAHWGGSEKTVHGEALTVFRVREGRPALLMARTHYLEPKVWQPIKVEGVEVRQGDRIQFYYDSWNGCSNDELILRGGLVQQVYGVTKVYSQVEEFSPSTQGGTTGSWFYRFDRDRNPNPDGVYEELPQPNWTVHQVQGTGWGRGQDRKNHQGFLGYRLLALGEAQSIVDEAIPVLEPGVYQATAAARSGDGKVLGLARYNFIRFDHERDLPWIGNKLGIRDGVEPPWTPIQSKNVGGRAEKTGLKDLKV